MLLTFRDLFLIPLTTDRNLKSAFGTFDKLLGTIDRLLLPTHREKTFTEFLIKLQDGIVIF
jgi:hypothetical protein